MKWSDYTNRILAELDTEAYFTSVLNNIQRHGTEVKAECPFKDMHSNSTDNTPSLTVNLSKGVYYCQTCQSKGNIHTLHKLLYGLKNEEAWFELGDGLNIPRPDSSKPTRPAIDVGLVAEYHQALMKLSGPIRTVLREKRGYTDDTLKQFQLGWNGERITIPVYDEYNELVNFRLYKWNSNENKWKALNYTDEFGNMYGELRIYGIEDLLDESIDEIVWCEGETDRILLKQHGIPAACPTSGAGAWRPEWTKYFRNKKKVYLLQDNDLAGENATKKLCEKLYRVTNVALPKWPSDFLEKGDVTDFFVKCQQPTEALLKILEEAPIYVDPKHEIVLVDDIDAKEVHLADSANASLYAKRLKIPVMISGKDHTPYICPKKIKLSCGDHADADNKKCKGCDLAMCAGECLKVLSATDQDVMKLIKCTEKQQEVILKEIFGASKDCPYLQIDVEEYMNIEEVRMIPKAEANFGFSKEHEYVVRTGYFMESSLKANKRYTLLGYMYPEPQTQYATYIFDKAVPEKDLISDFSISDEQLEDLKVFQVGSKTIKEKMDDIHKDLERNVTYIWQRRNVAIATDLIYHTALNFYFQEQFVKRGWGELLIIGDSGQAKTTIVERLMAHYRLGELHSGESSKRTGLVYSIQQTNKRWFLVWGAFPLNDGGLITLDELSGIDERDLAVMSDVRSSGVAKATGVVTAETTARTRVIYISNPRNGRPLNTETFGIQAVLKLFGKTEDVRRLDLVVAVASGDIDPALMNINIAKIPEVPHRYTSDLCHLRTLWAWSRKPENIKFTKEATETILKRATEMGMRYSSKVPIVEAADQRIKIARLAIGCASSVFSTDNGEDVIVKPEHVQYVVDFMNEVYSSRALGYTKLSDQDKVNGDASDANLVDLRHSFIKVPLQNHNEIAKILYQLTYFSRNTLADFTGLERDELKLLLKFLTTKHLIEKYRNEYRRFPLGTEFLESILDKPISKEEHDEVMKELREQYEM